MSKHPIANSVRHKLIVKNKKYNSSNHKIDSHLYGMDSTSCFTNDESDHRLNSTATSPPSNIDNLSPKQRNNLNLNLNTDAATATTAIDFEALRSSLLRSVN